MARSAWIPLAIGGVGSVLLISGVQGESLAQVLKGEFGNAKGKPFPNPNAEPGQSNTSFASFGSQSGSSSGSTGSLDATPQMAKEYEEKYGRPPAPGQIHVPPPPTKRTPREEYLLRYQEEFIRHGGGLP